MNKLQRGFTLVESLLIILIAAVIGFGGWWVWHNHHKSTPPVSSTQTSKAKSRSANGCNLDNGWKGSLIQTGDKLFSFCQPNGWEFFFSDGNQNFFYAAEQMLAYDANTAPKQTLTGGNDNRWDLYLGSEKAGSGNLDGFAKQGTLAAQNGLSANEYYHLTGQNDSVGAGMDLLTQGTKQYQFLITKNSQEFFVSYIIHPGQAGQLNAIESLVKSVR